MSVENTEPKAPVDRLVMPLQRVTVTCEPGQPIWVEPDRNGEWVKWEDVARLVVQVSGLVARIEIAHDLHAVFTVKDSEEFVSVKKLISNIFKSA